MLAFGFANILFSLPILITISVGAVSYTHLDVYKRQDVFNEKDVAEIISENLGDRELSKDFLDGKLRNFEEMKINSIAFVKIIIAAVSYTHLDVYKRQHGAYVCSRATCPCAYLPV